MNSRTVMTCCVSLALIAGVYTSSCTKQGATRNSSETGDVYALVSVDGKRVPATVSHDGAELEVRSGVFTIHQDGTCHSKTVFVPPSGTEVTREVSATFTKDGAILTMQWEGAGITVGTLEGNRFTMNNEGMVFVYQK